MLKRRGIAIFIKKPAGNNVVRKALQNIREQSLASLLEQAWQRKMVAAGRRARRPQRLDIQREEKKS